MKRILFILFLCCIGSGLAACQDEDHTVPTLPSGNDPEINDPVVEFYDWEKNRTELLTSTDMVLLYGGGHHRTPYTWDKERVSSYIRYRQSIPLAIRQLPLFGNYGHRYRRR